VNDPQAVLPTLIGIIHRLFAESEGLLERQDDAQIWYNRGYGDGVVAAIRELGHGDALPSDLAHQDTDLSSGITAQALMPWGRAHAHGFEMGRKETFEVLEAA